MDAFRRSLGLADAAALHEWSVAHPGEFWQRIWDDCGVIGTPGDTAFDPADGTVRGGRFFPQSGVSYAENALALRDGRGDEAIVAITEAGDRRSYTWPQLRAEVAATAAALVTAGVQVGDRVAAYMPHVAETIITFLAASDRPSSPPRPATSASMAWSTVSARPPPPCWWPPTATATAASRSTASVASPRWPRNCPASSARSWWAC
jgi:hypothetical protein